MKKQFQCKRVSELKFALTLLHLARKLSHRFKGVTFASAILWHPATGWDQNFRTKPFRKRGRQRNDGTTIPHSLPCNIWKHNPGTQQTNKHSQRHNKQNKKNQADHHGDSSSLNMFIFFGLARPNRFKMSTVLKKDIGTNNQKLIVQKILVNKIVCLAVFDPYSRWNCALQA